jgi:hypothetical protein
VLELSDEIKKLTGDFEESESTLDLENLSLFELYNEEIKAVIEGKDPTEISDLITIIHAGMEDHNEFFREYLTIAKL